MQMGPDAGDSGSTVLSFDEAGSEAGPDGKADGGAAGSADSGAATALDPSVPTPSHDCRNDPSPNCISAAGTYNGVRIDEFCNMPNGPGVALSAGRWVIGCDNTNPGFARIYIPVQRPGSFSETVTPGTLPPMQLEFSADMTTSVAIWGSGPNQPQAANLVRAALAGQIAAPSASEREVLGTFYGEWSAPGSSCSGLSGSPCAAASLNITFRTQSNYGTCVSNADCTPPQTCDSVSYYCH
jgi:hypothetical protein